MDTNVPIFGEKDKYDNLEEWIFAIENAIKAANVPANLVLSVLPPYLRDLPAQTLMQFSKDKNGNGTWKEFKVILYDNFRQVDYKDRLKVQLRDLKQGDNYEQYARKFRAIVNLFDEMDDDDKIFWFTDGLNAKMRHEVRSKECKTLEEAFKVAARFDSCFGKLQVNVNYTNKINGHKEPYRVCIKNLPGFFISIFNSNQKKKHIWIDN